MQGNPQFQRQGFNLFNGLRQPGNSADRQRIMQQIASQIMGGGAQTVGEGAGQLIGGMAQGLNGASQQFPQAPGGGAPSPLMGLKNFFTGRQNGGLY